MLSNNNALLRCLLIFETPYGTYWFKNCLEKCLEWSRVVDSDHRVLADPAYKAGAIDLYANAAIRWHLLGDSNPTFPDRESGVLTDYTKETSGPPRVSQTPHSWLEKPLSLSLDDRGLYYKLPNKTFICFMISFLSTTFIHTIRVKAKFSCSISISICSH